MSITSQPVALAAGIAATITPPPSPWDTVVITNLSPFLLQVQVGAAAQWLNPWAEQQFKSPSSHAPIVLTPNTIAGTPQGVGQAQAQATFFEEGEGAGSYPSAITAAAVQSVQGNLTGVPLDVVPIGGLQNDYFHVLAGGFSAPFIAPGFTYAYRLHRVVWTTDAVTPTPGLGTLYGVSTGMVYSAYETSQGASNDLLNGQLVTEELQAANGNTSEQISCYFTYDIVLRPTIN